MSKLAKLEGRFFLPENSSLEVQLYLCVEVEGKRLDCDPLPVQFSHRLGGPDVLYRSVKVLGTLTKQRIFVMERYEFLQNDDESEAPKSSSQSSEMDADDFPSLHTIVGNLQKKSSPFPDYSGDKRETKVVLEISPCQQEEATNDGRAGVESSNARKRGRGHVGSSSSRACRSLPCRESLRSTVFVLLVGKAAQLYPYLEEGSHYRLAGLRKCVSEQGKLFFSLAGLCANDDDVKRKAEREVSGSAYDV